MANKLDVILGNTDNLNDTLDNVLESLQTMDLPRVSFVDDPDRIDRILNKASKYGNAILDSKIVKNTNDKLNNVLDDVGDYTMMLSIPALAFALATGTVGYVFVAPLLLAGGFITKKYSNRQSSILKKSGHHIKARTTSFKRGVKQKLKEKKEQKCLNNEDLNKIMEGKGSVTTSEFVSITLDRITENIHKINDKVALVSSKIKNDECGNIPKEEIIKLLQNDAVNTIVKLKVDMYNLNNIKQKTGFQPNKINPVLIQCKNTIDALSKNLLITNEMVSNKICDIKEKQSNAKFYGM